MSSNRTRPNKLLSIVVFTVGILAVAWYSQPATRFNPHADYRTLLLAA